MLLRALPHVPGHDGVRLFLPAFAVIALLVGLGVSSLSERWRPGAKWVLGAAIAEGLISLIVMMPVPLSYFSPLVGGLPGATGLGMEPTYYWDALDEEARSWLRDHTGAGETIRFATLPTSWLYLRQVGQLPRRLDGFDPGHPAWYVLQNRPGAWSPTDQARVRRSEPAFTVRKLGIPLIWIFPYELTGCTGYESEAATHEMRRLGWTRATKVTRPTEPMKSMPRSWCMIKSCTQEKG